MRSFNRRAALSVIGGRVNCGDKPGRDIKATAPRPLDDQRVGDKGPEGRRRKRLEASGH